MDQDFAGYMEGLQQAEADAAEQEAMWEAHQIWKETTWSGWFVRKIEDIRDHFRPFLEKILGMMADEESMGQILVFNLVRLLALAFCMGLVYALAKIIQQIIGKEIQVEEEVVVVHEYKSKEEAIQAMRAAKKKQEQPQPQQSRKTRSKTQKKE